MKEAYIFSLSGLYRMKICLSRGTFCGFYVFFHCTIGWQEYIRLTTSEEACAVPLPPCGKSCTKQSPSSFSMQTHFAGLCMECAGRFLSFSPWWVTTHLRLKSQKLHENPSLSGAKQFWRSRKAARRRKGRREYFVYLQGLWGCMGAFSARQNRVCPCQSRVTTLY